MSAHPDIQREQNYIDFAHSCLDAMRRRTGRLVTEELGAGEVDSEIVRGELGRRIATMAPAAGPLCFGRIDEESGRRFYIGRRHVKDDRDRSVVVDWRARVAAPFYRATIRDAQGLATRRRFLFEDKNLVDIFEENFLDPSSVAAGHGGVPDPLLAELSRARTGGMRDIVATIQAEQDEIIRWPARALVIVQGGPGTGKTAVGLHRVAFLLYEHRERLDREGVLVVGPNRIFLDYISAVLPSLGETSVRQTTIADMFGSRYSVVGTDPDEVAAIKGDARMAILVERACRDQLKEPSDDLKIRLSTQLLRIPGEAIADAHGRAAKTASDLSTGRALFSAMLEKLAYESYVDRHPAADQTDFQSTLRRSSEFKRARDHWWPAVNPARTVARLFASGGSLEGCARNLLPDQEIEILKKHPRPKAKKTWTSSDLPLLDEASTLIEGPAFVFGHVIVDEAQDLSPMDLRMLGRRSIDGSMTVLGDLAQATGVRAQTRWPEAVQSLASQAPARIFELDLGYRVPQPVMSFANRLLRAAAPHLKPTQSVRPYGEEPNLLRSDRDSLVSDAVEVAVAMTDRLATVALIASGSSYEALRGELAEAGIEWNADALGMKITLLRAVAAKGLEFDGVVVVDPQSILDENVHGARMLYVALTRTVQELAVIYAGTLPNELQPKQHAVTTYSR